MLALVLLDGLPWVGWLAGVTRLCTVGAVGRCAVTGQSAGGGAPRELEES